MQGLYLYLLMYLTFKNYPTHNLSFCLSDNASVENLKQT